MEKRKELEGDMPVSKITVKKPEDIKSFAESTMNELLGWYGYDSSKQEPQDARNSRSISVNNDSESETFLEGCGWCGKSIEENNSVVSATAAFCSELCFSQSRRASFKRNKTCDWCRHSHHTVSYVELQDNSTQLQFCSDSCLNQYKMHIFCRETQAHLELHPHIHEGDSSGNLITPDLWMKNCVSPPQTSRSPPKPPPIEPLHLITVAPPSKLLANDSKRNRSKHVKRSKRGGCSSTITSLCEDAPQDLRIRQSPPVMPETPPEVLSGPSKDDATCRVEEELKQESSQANLSSQNIRAILSSILPPPTTFVPYPVILPLPIPIPIPIPIPKMFETNTGKDLIELKHCLVQTDFDPHLSNNNNNCQNDLEIDDVEKESSDSTQVSQTRLLRKRKRNETKTKMFSKHKKTLATLP
ncbi:sine oculis-binding protein homolog [Anthonomus grandis grandis]|uniref:sine oculis-binding protein homolog n=1 Tax=Anthonomus grandis grandis TaxID=2921223 RepID=UPI0021652957|nr:sine oculis-binding protein homolog [Anthonomus grandis grandis]XP_050308981.1 sine oculis-binding protein homolog [Anthonomus grandis grandis]